MKKLLAIALLVAMLLTMGMFVTSCDNDEPYDNGGGNEVSEPYEPNGNGEEQYEPNGEEPNGDE